MLFRSGNERNEIRGGMRVVLGGIGEMVVHLYTTLGPHHAKENPRPNKHDSDADECENIAYIRA